MLIQIYRNARAAQ